MSVDVVPLRWWHLPEVAALEQELFPADAWSPEQFWSELAQPTRAYVVARDGAEVVGYAGAFLLPPDGDVQTIAVRADRQGRGLGSVLLGSLLDAARARGCRWVMLEVRAGNEPALALYAQHGFEQLSRRPSYYPDGEDALVLRVRLEKPE